MKSRPKNPRIPDTISDVSSSRTSVGPVAELPKHKVRAAQLVTASLAVGDPREVYGDRERESELAEVLDILGIYNRQRRVITSPGRRPVGIAQLGQVYRRTDREPSGRLSRAARKVKM